jgi:hypothetical protein
VNSPAKPMQNPFDPRIELVWHDQRTYPDTPQHLRGASEVIAFSERFRNAWADVVQEPLGDFIEAPDDRVLAPICLRGRGRKSGVPIEIHFFAVDTIRDGKLRRASTSAIAPTPSKPPGCRSRRPLLWTKSRSPAQRGYRTVSRILGRS